MAQQAMRKAMKQAMRKAMKAKAKKKAMKAHGNLRKLVSLKLGDAFYLHDGEGKSFGVEKDHYMKVVLLVGGARDGFVMCSEVDPARVGQAPSGDHVRYLWLPRDIRSLQTDCDHGWRPVL